MRFLATRKDDAMRCVVLLLSWASLSSIDAFGTTSPALGWSSPVVTTSTSKSRVSLARAFQQRHRQQDEKRHGRDTVLYNKADSEEADEEIDRLKSMAAKLRAEAAALEAEQQEEMAAAAERAFNKFDTNKDGSLSLEELKAGLEKTFQMELPEKRVKQLMKDFDQTGDGTLSVNEFVSVDRLRSKLDALAREEKAQALEKVKEAQAEAEAAKFFEAQVELINDRPPTATDKVVSVLPYLFPLLDGLQFARFIVFDNPDNIASALIALLYALYRSIPFGGLIAFFALSFLSGNPTLNRLVRFNMQQAIYLDISIFFPSLLAALIGIIGSGAGFQIPASAVELGNDFIFFTLLATVGYCAVSSLLGITPDKIPLISDAVNNRMPTVDMFDSEGHWKDRNKKDKE